jgi:hypothetical protein
MAVVPPNAVSELQKDAKAVGGLFPACGQLGHVAVWPALEQRFVDQAHHDALDDLITVLERIQMGRLALEVNVKGAPVSARGGWYFQGALGQRERLWFEGARLLAGGYGVLDRPDGFARLVATTAPCGERERQQGNDCLRCLPLQDRCVIEGIYSVYQRFW